MTVDLRGRVAVVTGASRGLGVHIALALAARGVSVALAARSADELERVAVRVRATGVGAIAVAADLTVAADRARLLERTAAELGPVDLLVNNAGVELAARFTDVTVAEVEQTIALNVTAPMLLTHAVVPGMLARGRGHVVTVASVAGKAGIPFEAPYSASKSAVITLMQALRAEYDGTPVGFSVVCPGLVTGEGMYARMAERGAKAPWYSGRTTPAKVARAVLRAVDDDRAELLVNTPPIRPLFVLGALAPSTQPALLRAFGVTATFQAAARTRRDEG